MNRYSKGVLGDRVKRSVDASTRKGAWTMYNLMGDKLHSKSEESLSLLLSLSYLKCTISGEHNFCLNLYVIDNLCPLQIVYSAYPRHCLICSLKCSISSCQSPNSTKRQFNISWVFTKIALQTRPHHHHPPTHHRNSIVASKRLRLTLIDHN